MNRDAPGGGSQVRPLRIWIMLALALSLLSMVLMTIADYRLGAEAESLNAYSVLERVLGREPSTGMSTIAERYGTTVEGLVVVLSNLVIGTMVTVMIKSRSGR